MEDLQALISSVFGLFQIEFTVYGFTLSFWQVLCFSVVAGVVAWIIGEVFGGE